MMMTKEEVEEDSLQQQVPNSSSSSSSRAATRSRLLTTASAIGIGLLFFLAATTTTTTSKTKAANNENASMGSYSTVLRLPTVGASLLQQEQPPQQRKDQAQRRRLQALEVELDEDEILTDFDSSLLDDDSTIPSTSGSVTNRTTANSTNATATATTAPSEPEDSCIDLLGCDLWPETLVALSEEGSPQSMAYEWLLEDADEYDGYELDAMDMDMDTMEMLEDSDNELDDDSSSNSSRYQYRFAMATLYYANNGIEWTSNQRWLSHNHSICDWYSSLEERGLTQDNYVNSTIAFRFPQASCEVSSNYDGTNRNDNLKYLWLVNNNLQGALPMELYLLPTTTLRSLHLSHNSLEGSLPSSLSALSNLNYVFLTGNGFRGSIHPSIYESWTQLEGIDLSHNVLFGDLNNIGAWTQLYQLDFSNNAEMGNVLPSELGLLTNLQYFNYGNNPNNYVTGEMPSELGLLSNLEYLLMPYCFSLTGTLPSEVYSSMTRLIHMDLKGHKLTELSPLVAQLSSLENLELSQNLLTSLPSELGLLTNNLLDFNAEINPMQETQLPSTLGQLTNLQSFLICNSGLSGTIPSEIGNMASLQDIHLCGSRFTGAIPSELGQLTLLTHLTVGDNLLTGSIPSELGLLTGSSGSTEDIILEFHMNDITFLPTTELCAPSLFVVADCLEQVACDCCDVCF